jgi:DHA1 family multidrug resistance protein-like MFS transporter
MTAQPLVYVALRAVLTQISRTNQGTTFGWFGLISDLGWVLGPLIMTGLLGVLDSLIFAVLGALAMLGAALAWTINYQLSEPAKKNQPPLTSSSHSN